MLEIIDRPAFKKCQSPSYNYFFDKQTGFFAEWGEKQENDPLYAPFPNIVDIEISKVVDKDYQVDNLGYNVVNEACNGCKFCYKNAFNGQKTISMRTSTFDFLMSKINQSGGVCQCALGINKISTCPDFWDIVKSCRENHGVIPNYTTRASDDLTERDYKNTAKYCGAVAVSFSDKDQTYNTVQKFLFHGTEQTNIHFMLSEETLERCYSVIDDCHTDDRLKNLNALVLLMFKNKTTDEFTTITNPQVYKKLVDYAKIRDVSIGFDSCSAYNYLKSIADDEDYDTFAQYVTSCCAGRFSAYVDVFMNYHACSFMEKREEWGSGIPITSDTNFIEDVWNHPQTEKFRRKNIERSDQMCNPCRYFD